MPLYNLKGQLYEYTIYEMLDYPITRYKRNSVYDNTLIQRRLSHIFLHSQSTSESRKPSLDIATTRIKRQLISGDNSYQFEKATAHIKL